MDIKVKINRNCSKCNGTGKMVVRGSKADSIEIVDCDQCFYKPFPDPSDWYQPVHNDTPFPKCMFDGLPPGVYGISCPCPKCSPWTL